MSLIVCIMTVPAGLYHQLGISCQYQQPLVAHTYMVWPLVPAIVAAINMKHGRPNNDRTMTSKQTRVAGVCCYVLVACLVSDV